MTKKTLYLLCLSCLYGCMLGPDYKKPETTLPRQWQSTASSEAAISNQQAWWQNFHDEVLNQFISKAAKDNFDLKIAETRITQARAMQAVAQAALRPGGDLMASANRQGNQIGFPGNSNSSFAEMLKQPFNIFKTGFDASWELDLFGGHRRDAESARADFTAAEFSRDDLRISILAEVAKTYFDIRRYQNQLNLAEQIYAANQKTTEITQQRFAVGDNAGIEVAQSSSVEAQSHSQIDYYRNLLSQAEFSLDVLLGEMPGYSHSLVNITAALPSIDSQLFLSTPAAVIAQRPDILYAERKLASATAQQGALLAKFFPDVSLTGFIGLFNTNAGNFLNVSSKSWSMGGNIFWPILSYGSLSANLDAANAKQQEAMHNYQKAILTALADVELAYTAYSEQDKFRLSLEVAVSAEQKAHAISIERYHAGLTNYLDVLEAARRLYNVQNQLYQAQAQTAQNLIAVYKSLGGGWQTT